MEFKRILKGRALYTESDKIWVAQGMTFFAVDYSGIRVTPKFKAGNLKQRLLSSNRLSRQLLREGIHHLVPLNNGNVFLTAKRKSYVIDKAGKIVNIFSGYLGNKPAHQGVCVTPDGTVFFGEYTLNPDRDHDTHLYRSTDNGQSFQIILTLSKNECRHIHFVKYDPYEKCLWLGTGDEDCECRLFKSLDNGDSWELVGSGCQDWRAIGVNFDKDSLIWGTDAGSVPDTNHIVRMDRKTHELKIIGDAEGPCHGCGSFSGGRIFISTGVEGGQNELDNFARLKEIDDGTIIDLKKIKKDFLPLILQYGVMRFPLGTDNTDYVVFTTMGLSMNGETVYVEQKNWKPQL